MSFNSTFIRRKVVAGSLQLLSVSIHSPRSHRKACFRDFLNSKSSRQCAVPIDLLAHATEKKTSTQSYLARIYFVTVIQNSEFG